MLVYLPGIQANFSDRGAENDDRGTGGSKTFDPKVWGRRTHTQVVVDRLNIWNEKRNYVLERL